MAKVIAVIGAGYGDEGKGLLTDYLCDQHPAALNVRFNGGSQAGHTVTTPQLQRHVFSHFGAGTFTKTPTFLSKHFVVNPEKFAVEHREFVQRFGFKPEIYVHKDAVVTTPYEMLVNQILEEARGRFRHGSVGVGFGETLERELTGINLTVINIMLQSRDVLKQTLDRIRSDFVEERLSVIANPTKQNKALDEPLLRVLFAQDCRYMLDNVTIVDDDFLKLFPTLIFEGAQGLLLDQQYGYFPHVTRSNCGMKNVMDILGSVDGDHDINVHYVTRAYTTRHGEGPLEHDDFFNVNILQNNQMETNRYGQFQREFRYAPLNIDLMTSVTDKDFALHAPRSATKSWFMTCVDQITYDIPFTRHEVTTKRTKESAENMLRLRFDGWSEGPTRTDVTMRNIT